MSESLSEENGSGVYLLDYGAGNVRSIRNAIKKVGCTDLKIIQSSDDFAKAKKLVFPGVGAFGACMARLKELGYIQHIKDFIASGKPFLGICLGMQTLFEGSEECPGVEGLGVIPGMVTRFTVDQTQSLAVPHIGWNGVNVRKPSPVISPGTQERFYFVHSYLALATPANNEWVMTTTNYGAEFISSVQKGNVLATQFHPEKSSQSGMALFKQFLDLPNLIVNDESTQKQTSLIKESPHPTQLASRVIACLDVRSNDSGDLVVTKGDNYDCREKEGAKDIRNLGKPVELAQQYYNQGADEVTFLNITSFRNSPMKDQPMLEVLKKASEGIFVPLTIGGGIRDLVEPDGTKRTALEVAGEYFRSGADKVSIGSDAVLIAEEFIKTGIKTKKTSIEMISEVYGSQAVVISVDPRRVYVASPASVKHHTIKTATPGPNGETFCWYECTIKGGREARDLGAYELVRACEALGAGEILLNCIDKDGTNSGYDLELIADIKSAVLIPVIASSGAGNADHFYEVFTKTKADAALAAGIFHRREVPLETVKNSLIAKGLCIRPCPT